MAYACITTELSLISLHWFLTLFASVVHMKVLLRIWDLFFYEGSAILFQMTMGMLKMKVCTRTYMTVCNLSSHSTSHNLNHMKMSESS